MYKNRTYRNQINNRELVLFQVSVEETDLMISAKKKLIKESTFFIKKYRKTVESYILKNPEFRTTLQPLAIKNSDPYIIKDMKKAGQKAEVGPMASIAGVISEYVGKSLLKYSDEIIIENGGDTFIKVDNPLTVGIYAGDSPLSSKIGIHFMDVKKMFSVCTSSGTFGHSHSMGNADAVCVISESAPLADAAATAICNKVKKGCDIQNSIDFGKQIKNIKGIIIIIKEQMGVWGDVELVRIP